MITYDLLPTVTDLYPDDCFAFLSIYLELGKPFAINRTAEERENDSPHKFTGFLPMNVVEFIEGQPALMPCSIPKLTTVRVVTSKDNPEYNAYRITYVFESLEKLMDYVTGTTPEFMKAKDRWKDSEYGINMKGNRKWINGVPYDDFVKNYKKAS